MSASLVRCLQLARPGGHELARADYRKRGRLSHKPLNLLVHQLGDGITHEIDPPTWAWIGMGPGN